MWFEFWMDIFFVPHLPSSHFNGPRALVAAVKGCDTGYQGPENARQKGSRTYLIHILFFASEQGTIMAHGRGDYNHKTI